MTLTIRGLSASDQSALDELWAQLDARSLRNTVRAKYYDHKNTLVDLGISIPPSLKTVETVVGWPAKGVDVLARRLVLDGWVNTDGADVESIGVNYLADANRLQLESAQSTTSTLVHACSFLAVTAGDVTAGEPEAIITARSARYATGMWDARRRRLRSALTIISKDDQNVPDHLVIYVPNRAIICRREGQRWDIRQARHDLGVPVELLPFEPLLDRPFGRSRISRAMMALTDSAVRTLLRMEVSAEFYSAPQRYVLGADEDAFTDREGNPVPAWQSILGRMLAVGKDEDGDVPTVGQFTQQSMQPHSDQLRSLAAMFASEASLPLSALGIIHDNPSSAQAMENAEKELVAVAQQAEPLFRDAWTRTMRRALVMLDDSPAAIDQYAQLRAKFRNPATPSMSAMSDAAMKLISVGVLPPDSEVAYDMLNFTEPQRETLRAEQRRARAMSLAGALSEPAAGAVTI